MRNSDPTAPLPQGDNAANHFFIGGIQRHISKDDLVKYFGGFGEVSNILLKHDSSGNPRGFGWLTYRSQAPGLIRPDPHILKGVRLTVEQALSRGPRPTPKRNDFNHSQNNRRRPRSSRDSSRSRSSSSSSSSSIRRRFEHRRGASPGGGKNQLPTISSNSRLPRLSTTNSNIVPSTPAAPQNPPPPPPPMYNQAPTAMGTARPPASALSQETYVCIPFALCPPQYLTDPRIFCARLDQSRIGGLQIVQSPFSVSTAPVTPDTALGNAGALQAMPSAMSRQ